MSDYYPIYNVAPAKDRYYIFGNKKNIPSENIIAEKIYQFARETDNLNKAVAIALIYLTASRVREVTKYKYVGKADKEMNIEFPPLSIKDITIETKRGYDWLVIDSRVEKIFHAKPGMTEEERLAQLEVEKRKPEPTKIPLDERFPLFKLAQLVIEQIINLTEPFESVDKFNQNSIKYGHIPLYDMTDRALRYFLKKYFNIYPHLLRHWRANHLVQNYNYKTSDLMKAVGWKSPTMALYYAESTAKDLEDKLIKRLEEGNSNI